jgi:tetratricopeptide (TPR) repeat protein
VTRAPAWPLLALTVGVLGCSAPALSRYESIAADDDPAAAQAWTLAEVTAHCHGPRPDRVSRGRCGRALLRLGELREDGGAIDDAIATYAAIADAAVGDERAPPTDRALRGLDRRAITTVVAAEARFRAGRLAHDHGQLERAGRDLWRLVVELPDEPRAGDAVEFLVARVRGEQPRALWQRLSALATALPDTAVADNLLWWLADLAAHELGDPTAALVLYDRIPVEYPRSGLRDDARWRGAQLASTRGDPTGALERLRGLLATREVAFGTGSYLSIWLDDAALLSATILRDQQGDHRAAMTAFARLVADYPRSILVDDALAGWAELAAADGDLTTACRVARRLLAHDPASRFAARARALAAAPDCPASGH